MGGLLRDLYFLQDLLSTGIPLPQCPLPDLEEAYCNSKIYQGFSVNQGNFGASESVT